jgi:MoxR-like ATPase
MDNRQQITRLQETIEQSIIGQEHVVSRLVIGLLANGNLLLEGLPGLAKTRAVKSLAKGLAADFSRIQFTPDLLPADITGTEVMHTEAGGPQFRFEAGPIFANIVLADEINRAPAKVQAALLEAMEERQVTVAGTTHRMPDLFMVMATQNPVEQEGTYPLPEAQMDRFLMHVYIDYPDEAAEGQIIRLVRGEEQATVAPDTASSESSTEKIICGAGARGAAGGIRRARRDRASDRQRCGRTLHGRSRLRDPLPGALHGGSQALDPGRGEPARCAGAGQVRACPCLA